METITSEAAVIGGGVAGLCAAAAAAKHFGRVTILEKDRLSLQPGDRPGTPHGSQPHALLLRGQQELENLFPGIRSEFLAAGALNFNLSRDALWVDGDREHPRYDDYPLTSLTATRGLFEAVIRRRVLGLENVRIIGDRDVYDLVTCQRTSRVLSLRTRSSTAGEGEYTADLFIDASGRKSRSINLLEKRGFPEPVSLECAHDVQYVSGMIDLTERIPWSVFLRQPVPESPQGGIAMKVEGTRLLVATITVNTRRAHTGSPAFALNRAFNGRLPIAHVPAKLHRYHFRKSHLWFPHRSQRWPGNLLLLGDAAGAFNPIFGQGMTLAVIAATMLDSCLSSRLPQINAAQSFHRHLTPVLRQASLIANMDGLRWKEGKLPLFQRLMRSYSEEIIDSTFRGKQYLLRFHRVHQMLSPQYHLISPSHVAKVVMNGSWRHRGLPERSPTEPDW